MLAGSGGCFHMSGITLGTSCVLKDGPHNLGDPSLLGNVPLAVFWMPFLLKSQVSFVFLCVASWGWRGAPICLELR